MDLFVQIKSYYDEVELGGKPAPLPIASMAQRSLVRKRNELEPYFALPETGMVSYTEIKMPTLWRRANAFRREHPITSSSIAMAILALVAVSLSFLWPRQSVPGYYYYNTSANQLDVYSNSNKLLWSLPAIDIGNDEQYEISCAAHKTIIADLDNNGQTDVFTTVPLRNQNQPSPLTVYNAEGKLVKTVDFGSGDISFRGERYYTPFGANFLISEKMPGGSKNLFVYADNGRSPAFLARYDDNLKLVGKYWHYGDFAPYLAGPYHDGVRDIVIAGENDLHEMSGGKFDFVALLDPTKIVGNRECSATPGFGFRPSDAEIYYIKLPRSSLERAGGIGGKATVIDKGTDSLLYVEVKSSEDNLITGFWGFDFFFSTKDMSVLEVKYTSPTPETFNMFKKEGKITGTFDDAYLQNLKNGVRYWNGKTWVKRPTRIIHNSEE